MDRGNRKKSDVGQGARGRSKRRSFEGEEGWLARMLPLHFYVALLASCCLNDE